MDISLLPGKIRPRGWPCGWADRVLGQSQAAAVSKNRRRSMTAASSRTLPGQGYSTRRPMSSVAGTSVGSPSLFAARRAK